MQNPSTLMSKQLLPPSETLGGRQAHHAK